MKNIEKPKAKDHLDKFDETTQPDAESPVKLMERLNAFILEYEKTKTGELIPKIQKLFLQLEAAFKDDTAKHTKLDTFRKKLLELKIIKPE